MVSTSSPGDFAVANLAYRLIVQDLGSLDHLTQVRFLAAGNDILRRYVTNHARDARERWGHAYIVRKQGDELVFAIRTPLPRIMLGYKPRSFHEHAGIELDLIGLEGDIAHETLVIAPVTLCVGAIQVKHEVRMNLEAEDAQQLEGTTQGIFACRAIVEREDLRTQALHADLHFRASEQT